VAFLVPEVGLVACDRPDAWVNPLVPGLVDAAGHVPGGGLPNAEVAMQLHARDALEAGREQVNGHGPSAVAELGVVHQGAGLGGKVVAALPAAVGLGLAGGPGLDVGGAAGRAADTVRPEDRREPALGGVLVGEQAHQFGQCDALAVGSAGISPRHDPRSSGNVSRPGQG